MITAIILAAGNGSRMNSNVKKQYMEIAGKPVIWHAINSFESSDVDEIILITGENEIEYCKKLVNDSGFKKVTGIVAGGKERYDSVYRGLCECSGAKYVLIHDGARPLIETDTINECIRQVKIKKAVVVAVPVKDTIKIVGDNGNVVDTPKRDKLWSIQTPQAFEFDLIKQSYKKMYEDNAEGITDDSMVVEKYSDRQVYITEGKHTNIKITTSEDISVAELFLKKC